LAIFAQSVFHIASRGFYARQDTKTPFIVSVVSIGFSIILSIVFTTMGFGPDGLGWAQSIGAVVEMFILLGLLNKRSNHQLFDKTFMSGIWRMLMATVVTSVSAYVLTKFFPLLRTDDSFFVTFPKFMIISLGSLLIYIFASYLLELKEASPIMHFLGRILFGNLDNHRSDKKD
jgi:integral membrane protein mviN